MYPLDTGTFSFRHRTPDKLSTDAMSLELWMHGRVQNERMIAAIPRQIDETYQSLFAESTDEREAAIQHGREVAPCVFLPSGGEQRVQFIICQRRADAVIHYFEIHG